MKVERDMSCCKTCKELLELINQQTETIAKQNDIIAKLTNESFEQENLINVLMRERIDE